MIPNILTILTDTGQTAADDISKRILQGVYKVGPWLCGILSVLCIIMIVFNVIKYFLAKQQGNDQAVEKNKKGIIWGIGLFIICASFTVLCGFIIDIANAFRDDGSQIAKPNVAIIYIQQLGLLIRNLL